MNMPVPGESGVTLAQTAWFWLVILGTAVLTAAIALIIVKGNPFGKLQRLKRKHRKDKKDKIIDTGGAAYEKVCRFLYIEFLSFLSMVSGRTQTHGYHI